MSTVKLVYVVHAVKPEAICATEVVFTSAAKADEWAIAVSTDPCVLAGAVTRYTLDLPGECHPESLFVKGARQQVAHLSDDREIAANGYL
jgi:hypothetical protein